MPKRRHENSLKFIANKLRKLEEEVKRSRRARRNCIPTSSSSSASSQSSSRSSSPSSCSSRAPTPNILQNPDYQEVTTNPVVPADAIDIELPPVGNNDTTPVLHTSPIVISDNSPEGTSAPTDAVEDASTNAEIIEILGADPSVTQDYGPDINKEVATRFTHIATSGLDKEVRNDLIKKHLVPGNCTNIAAPQLNAEIKAALTEQVVKRDRAIEARQKQLAAGISFLSKIISDQLGTKDKNNDLIKDLMEVGRMFCDIQHSESEARRHFALYTVKKELKDQLSNTKIDKLLFGNNFIESLKTAKAVSKSSSDLKPDAVKKSKAPTPTGAGSSSKHLNWKARTPVRRQPTAHPPRYQPPASNNPQPRGTSSHNYTQRSKQTRRQ